MILIPENILLRSFCAVNKPITNQKNMQGLNCTQLRSKEMLPDNLVYDKKQSSSPNLSENNVKLEIKCWKKKF